MDKATEDLKKELLEGSKTGQVILLESGPHITTDEGVLVSLGSGKTLHKEDVKTEHVRGWSVDIDSYLEQKIMNDPSYKRQLLSQFASDVEDEVVFYIESGEYDDYEKLPDLLRGAIKEFVK